jgi:hypothetical protein
VQGIWNLPGCAAVFRKTAGRIAVNGDIES